MDDRKKYTIDKERLERLNDMKPAFKNILGFTARLAFKMMKMVVKTAIALPGFVKRMSATSHSEAGRRAQKTDIKSSSAGARNIPVN